jgi:hypothetical protein
MVKAVVALVILVRAMEEPVRTIGLQQDSGPARGVLLWFPLVVEIHG